jgi:hypothetical protein
MPFKPTSLPAQIASARGVERSQIDAPPTSYSAGAAQRAKVSSYRWTQSNIRNPQSDSAAPWFSGTQPFSELRFQNGKNFDGWQDRFRGTDSGWKFDAPPPEPEPTPQPQSQPQSAGKPNEEVS